MFFEGSEKKVEIVLSANQQDLLKLEHAFWQELVTKCKASILSEISNEKLKAFLLSESSLFVWSDRIVMITCGGTQLINSILSFVHHFGANGIDSIIYQRKNEYDPRKQESSFFDDIEILKNELAGVALRFGHLDGHHNYLYNLEKKYTPAASDKTSELLIYQIQGEAAEVLRQKNQPSQKIRSLIGFERVTPDFLIDDFVFSPYGYSLNGIRGEDYITVHITPQEDNSYVSFETNIESREEVEKLFEHMLKLFNPGSFDLISFNTQLDLRLEHEYWQGPLFQEKTNSGYDVSFKQFFKKTKEVLKAMKL